jgi:hypothetical protein
MSNVAVHLEGDLAVRIARVLLAERGVHIGMFGDAPTGGRVRSIDTLERADVLIAEAGSLSPELEDDAGRLRLPVISPGPLEAPVDAVRIAVTDVANPSHVVLAAADGELRDNRELVHATAAWTTHGRPLRSGVAATFPDPVGPRWAVPADPPPAGYPLIGLAAPVDGAFAAASLRVVLGTGDGVEDVTFGVVDQREFLTAVMLAAAALTAADGAYTAGLQGPVDQGGVFLDYVTKAGLVVGRFDRT